LNFLKDLLVARTRGVFLLFLDFNFAFSAEVTKSKILCAASGLINYLWDSIITFKFSSSIKSSMRI
jgi:hypothetical protein